MNVDLYADYNPSAVKNIMSLFDDFDLDHGQDHQHQVKLLCEIIKNMNEDG